MEKKMEDGRALARDLLRGEEQGRKAGRDGCEYGDDDLNEPFLCFICLELVHKPVVNACGHMFCFWCVHQAMNTDTESYCPLCRRPYMHFPRICEQLHFLLLKAVPDAYRRRCKEIYEEEPMSSPQFNDGLDFDGREGDHILALQQSTLRRASSVTIDQEGTQHLEEEGASTLDVQDDHIMKGKLLDTSSSSSSLKSDLGSTEGVGESIAAATEGTASSSPYVTVSDLLCTSCKKLLYRPVVVNCGHVFCEECVTGVEDADTGESILKCFTCGSIHPGGFPHVCLELHQYLEQNFSIEYEKRKHELAALSPDQQNTRNNSNKDLLTSDISKKIRKSTPQPQPRMHTSIGCDGCGMFPMLGRRFKCRDCPEIPGYDLCWQCYKNGTNLMGRFNQQHTSEHRIREVTRSPLPFEGEFQEPGEGSEGMETYFGIVGYFA